MDDLGIHIESGTQIIVPEIPTRLPVKYPTNAHMLARRSNEALRPDLLRYFANAADAEGYLKIEAPMWGLMSYPDTLADRVRTSADVMIPMSLLDDQFRFEGVASSPEGAERVRTRYLSMLGGVRPEGPISPESMIYDALQPILTALPPALRRRYLDSIIDLVNVFVDEVDINVSGRLPTLQEYLPLRARSIYGPWTTVHVEYALGIDMTEPLKTSPALREARYLTEVHLGLTNDLYSFYKEYLEGHSLNAIFVLMRERGLDLQQAVEHLGRLIEQTEERFYDQSRQVLANEIGQNPEVRAYLTGLSHLSGGTLEHARTVAARYSAQIFKPTGTTSGILTLDRDLVVHVGPVE